MKAACAVLSSSRRRGPITQMLVVVHQFSPSSTMIVDELWSKLSIKLHDDFAHEGDNGDHFGFAIGEEPFEEGAHERVMISGAESGGEENAFDSASSAKHGAMFSGKAGISGMGSTAGQACGCAAGKLTQFGQEGLQDSRGV